MRKYLSVCSGIEAASIAWEPLGWVPVMRWIGERIAAFEAMPEVQRQQGYVGVD